MGILTRWAYAELIKEPETILKVVEGDETVFKVRVKRKKLIEKIKKSDQITTEFINYFEAEEVSIEKDDILKIMRGRIT